MMNNKVKCSMMAVAASLSLSAVSTSTMAMDERVENALIDICKSAKSNKPIRMRHTIDGYNLSVQDVALKVMCNGDDIITFAEKRGAERTAARLERSLGGVDIIDVAATNKLSVTFPE